MAHHCSQAKLLAGDAAGQHGGAAAELLSRLPLLDKSCLMLALRTVLQLLLLGQA